MKLSWFSVLHILFASALADSPNNLRTEPTSSSCNFVYPARQPKGHPLPQQSI